jgi:hypothetical protein
MRMSIGSKIMQVARSRTRLMISSSVLQNALLGVYELPVAYSRRGRRAGPPGGPSPPEILVCMKGRCWLDLAIKAVAREPSNALGDTHGDGKAGERTCMRRFPQWRLC